MAPPPATPTPHRFLVPRRSQQVQAKNDETPKAFQFQASGLQQSQFQATPKFSLHSTPRPLGPGVSSTPAAPATISRQRNNDPINDIIDSSPPPLARASINNDGHYHRQQSYEPIEVNDIDLVLESSPIQVADREGDSDDGLEIRLPKRRRLSVSSFGPPTEEEEELQDGNVQGFDMEIDSSLPNATPSPDDAYASATDSNADDIEDADAESSFHSTEEISGAQQPTFHRAPRFKSTVEPPEGWPSLSSHRAEPLPDAFSPHHRKGSKYIPGGLATSLRDWLIDVEAGSGSGAGTAGRSDEEWIARIRVDEVRGGSNDGITLVTGLQLAHDGQPDTSTSSLRIMLAGPGRLVGLARRNEVRPGDVVGVARPTWEVVLQNLGRWAVACDWTVFR
ncbi:hypothetical protein F5X99DRAFT_378474 [Biscogniauxia marginata]|nr:hypothetical protein F5X99DRAFT_378474 [Biscogniauxia marginata]